MTEPTKPKWKIDTKSTVQKTTVLLPRTFQSVPEVWYTPLAWTKIERAISICPDEVGWLGTVEVLEEGYLVTDIFVPEQIVTGSETDISAEALADIAAGLEDPSKLIYWGHSHVNMGVVPSFQDEEQTAEYLEHMDVFIRGIYNKKGASKVDVFDMEKEICYQTVPNSILFTPMNEEEMTSFEEGVRANVKKQTYAERNKSIIHTTGTTNKGGNNGHTNRAKDTREMQGNSRKGRKLLNPFIVRGRVKT